MQARRLDLLGRVRNRDIRVCKNLYVLDVDLKSEASVSTESIITFKGPAEAAGLLRCSMDAKEYQHTHWHSPC